MAFAAKSLLRPPSGAPEETRKKGPNAEHELNRAVRTAFARRFTTNLLPMVVILALTALTGCDDLADDPTGPSSEVNVGGAWTGTQTTISVTSGTHCVNTLLQNLVAANRLSESLAFQILQTQDRVHITPTVSSIKGGSYEGRVSGGDFSATFHTDYGALGQPTSCSGTSYVLVERGGAVSGRISSGTLTGTGTRDFYITDTSLRQVGSVTATYQFSVRR